MQPETYFKLLEPNSEKLNQLMKTLKMILERRKPPNSGKTTLLYKLCSVRNSQSSLGHLINTHPLGQPDSAWNIDFTKHFIWVRDLSDRKNRYNIDVLKDLSNKDHQVVWNNNTKQQEHIQPTFWFLLDETEAIPSQDSIDIQINMMHRVTYVDLTQTFTYGPRTRRVL